MSRTYSIKPTDGAWSLSLDGKEQASFLTMQEAIETAKAKAAREGRSVLWEDREGNTHGPVRPSMLGTYSPSALRQRLGLSETPVTNAAQEKDLPSGDDL